MRAQFNAFSKQIPLLYFILTSNSLAASYTFARFAPAWLSIYAPVMLSALCFLRAVWWLRARSRQFSDAEVLRHMRMTTVLAAALTLAFTTWGLLLYPYGDPYAQGQVVFYMALTVIGCVFCLMHLRPAALLVTLMANIPFILYFFFEGHASLRAMAVNLLLVSAAMVMILLVYSRDFERLVASQAETRRLSEDNFRIANCDSLTELANRRWFFTELDATLGVAKADGKGFAVGIIDLDGFKPVNDTYGHATGDRVLVEAARRLRAVCGGHASDQVTLARLGGDEFGFIYTGNPNATALDALNAAIQSALRQPFAIGASHALLGASIGVACYPSSSRDAEGLFERADYALYQVKRRQRGQMLVFSAEHEGEINAHRTLEHALQNADLDAELSLAFQPIIDVASGETTAFEALARWTHPTLGAVGPDAFIPAAERTGMIRQVTKTLLTKALAALKTWPEPLRLSFNLSAHDLSDAETAVQIIALINRSGVNPRRLDFEITETAIANDARQARAAAVTFKAMGVGISLDDFGTGYSSLSHVHKLPLDKLKIDRSFVTDIEHNGASLKIVKSLIALCADMGLTCIVEGVETEGQLRTLRALGCRAAQGYYYARPMSGDAVSAWLQPDAADNRAGARI
ncbi:MAG TPA: EAL domain-containing protein [Asticcacaulis sp.]|nr:EAL domain-containing protein [Asticcacaulis sp.]